jgi:hypothetical protein
MILDDPYTLDQLMSPRINVSIVRPLTDRLYDPDDVSMGKLDEFDIFATSNSYTMTIERKAI